MPLTSHVAASRPIHHAARAPALSVPLYAYEAGGASRPFREQRANPMPTQKKTSKRARPRSSRWRTCHSKYPMVSIAVARRAIVSIAPAPRGGAAAYQGSGERESRGRVGAQARCKPPLCAPPPFRVQLPHQICNWSRPYASLAQRGGCWGCDGGEEQEEEAIRCGEGGQEEQQRGDDRGRAPGRGCRVGVAGRVRDGEGGEEDVASIHARTCTH